MHSEEARNYSATLTFHTFSKSKPNLDTKTRKKERKKSQNWIVEVLLKLGVCAPNHEDGFQCCQVCLVFLVNILTVLCAAFWRG
jgi:hypothetical protein